MKILFYILTSLALVTSARANGDYQFYYTDTGMTAGALRSVSLYPELVSSTSPYSFLTLDPLIKFSDLSGGVVFSNQAPGTYMAVYAGTRVMTTNWFSFPETNGYLYASNFVSNAYIYPGSRVPAYSTIQSDLRYWQMRSLVPGYNTTFRTNGNPTTTGNVYIDTQAGTTTAGSNVLVTSTTGTNTVNSLLDTNALRQVLIGSSNNVAGTFTGDGSGLTNLSAVSSLLTAFNAWSGSNSFNFLVVGASGVTNLGLTANTALIADGGQKEKSLANGGANTFMQGTTPPTYTSIPDSALSANVALLNAANVFTANQVETNSTGSVKLTADSLISSNRLTAKSVTITNGAVTATVAINGNTGNFSNTVNVGSLNVSGLTGDSPIGTDSGKNIVAYAGGPGITVAGGTFSLTYSAFNPWTGSNSFNFLVVGSTGITNLGLTANTALIADANQKEKSLANGGANTFMQGTTPPTYTSIPDAALSANVPLLNAANAFSASNAFTGTIDGSIVQAKNWTSRTNQWAGGSSAALDLNNGTEQEYTMTTDCTITGFANRSFLVSQTVLLTLTNNTASDHTLTVPAGCTTVDGSGSAVVTNKCMRSFSFHWNPIGYTNMLTQPFWR
jgi:hypothetical protein